MSDAILVTYHVYDHKAASLLPLPLAPATIPRQWIHLMPWQWCFKLFNCLWPTTKRVGALSLVISTIWLLKWKIKIIMICKGDKNRTASFEGFIDATHTYKFCYCIFNRSSIFWVLHIYSKWKFTSTANNSVHWLLDI